MLPENESGRSHALQVGVWPEAPMQSLPSRWLQWPIVVVTPSLLQFDVAQSSSTVQFAPIGRGAPHVCVSAKQ
jgi:hypothetical protein